jgi:hypothetical protein
LQLQVLAQQECQSILAHLFQKDVILMQQQSAMMLMMYQLGAQQAIQQNLQQQQFQNYYPYSSQYPSNQLNYQQQQQQHQNQQQQFQQQHQEQMQQLLAMQHLQQQRSNSNLHQQQFQPGIFPQSYSSIPLHDANQFNPYPAIQQPSQYPEALQSQSAQSLQSSIPSVPSGDIQQLSHHWTHLPAPILSPSLPANYDSNSNLNPSSPNPNPNPNPNSNSNLPMTPQLSESELFEQNLSQLVQMGFADRRMAAVALRQTHGDVQAAVELLVNFGTSG